MTRVTVVEDHVLYAEALALALTAAGHVVERVTPRESLTRPGGVSAAIATTRPAVVLLDLDLGRSVDVVSLLLPLQRADAAVVVLTGSTDEARWGECLWHGARTVLPKSTTLDTILATIRRVGTMQPMLADETAARFLGRYREEVGDREHVRVRLDRLTAREQEILRALMRGRRVREIARAQCVAESTVRTQVRSVLRKLEVSSQLAAVGLALRAGWWETSLSA